MVTRGIDRIKVSVRDMAESLAFFRDTMELAVVGQDRLDGSQFGKLWDEPPFTSVEAAWLKNNEQSTAIELIQVSPHSGAFIRQDARPYDWGLFDVAFRAKDIDEVYAELKKQGYDFLSAPVVYTADWVNLTVKEVILISPDRMPIALIERLSGDKPVIQGRFGTMVDAAQFVPEMEDAVRFYTEILGYNCFFDKQLADGLVDELLQLPPGTRSRMALLVQGGTQTPAVELVVTSAAAESLAGVVSPARTGLFALSFETDSLSELLARCQAAGYPTVGGPIELETGIHGRARAAVVRGPNQVLLEFFEK